MRAQVVDGPGRPLQSALRARPTPGPGQIRVRVQACGVCRTDLHVIDGDLPWLGRPVVPGHEIVGRVDACGPGVTSLSPGQPVGVPWLGRTCGQCRFCTSGRENLCPDARFTGYHFDGGYAGHVLVDADFALPLPEGLDPVRTAPLMCAGLIGHRTLRMAGDARRIGLYGFGAAAHLVAQIARFEGREVYAFTRPGDSAAQAFARSLGACWAGASDERPPEPLDAALIFAPAGELVPAALKALDRGGVVVCGGIHMSDIPSFPYADLWHERRIVSVANLTRRDGREFVELALRVGLNVSAHPYPLADAARAVDDLRTGRLTGAAVLVPQDADLAA